MNKQAEQYCAKAKDYLAKGDQFYRKAKPEIQAAYQVPGTRQEDIAKYLGRSVTWVQDVIAWNGEGTLYGKDTEARQRRQTSQTLREASVEQVEQIIDQLPAERRVEIAEAALKPEKNERQRDRKTRQANREEQHEDPARYAAQVVSLDLRKANVALMAAVGDAQDTNWPQEWSDRLLARVAVTAELLDMLRMTLTNSDVVDWDRELARLTEAADAAGKEF